MKPLCRFMQRLPFTMPLWQVGRAVVRLPRFLREFRRYREMQRARGEAASAGWGHLYPCLDDRTAGTPFDRHYVFHVGWALRSILAARPGLHVDVSSAISFVVALSASLPVVFFDMRPARLPVSGLMTGAADLLRLPFRDGALASVSCLHVLEHVGLGRYGDTLDPEGDRKAARELARVLAPGGTLYLVVPVGTPRVEFNAHRVYAPIGVDELFSDLRREELALIPDRPEDGDLIANPPSALLERQVFGCGCFRFRRGGGEAR